ncbi:NEAT domain-containing protein [Staphylococcus auricularis]|uniref:NEAT domain-containing protein n=1 Tax=Staphylococcus auricularis TaxID=29379 RepID=UPI003F7AE407
MNQSLKTVLATSLVLSTVSSYSPFNHGVMNVAKADEKEGVSSAFNEAQTAVNSTQASDTLSTASSENEPATDAQSFTQVDQKEAGRAPEKPVDADAKESENDAQVSQQVDKENEKLQHNQIKTEGQDLAPSMVSTEATSEDVRFYVRRAESHQASIMDQYVKHPGKRVVVNDQLYFEVVLTHASKWQSYTFFNEEELLEVQEVDHDQNKDETTLRIPISKETTSIKSEVRIHIPELADDETYQTVIELTPNEQSNQPVKSEETGDTSNGAHDYDHHSESSEAEDGKKDEHGGTNNQDLQEEQDEVELPGTDGTKPNKGVDAVKPDDLENASTPHQSSNVPVKSKTVSKQLKYVAKTEDRKQHSPLNDYMTHPARIVLNNKQYELQLTLKHASQWKSYDFYDGKRKLNTREIERDEQADTVTIGVPVKAGMKELTLKGQLQLQDVDFNKQVTTRIEFDKPIPTLESNTGTATGDSEHASSGSKTEAPSSAGSSTEQSTVNDTEQHTGTSGSEDETVSTTSNQPAEQPKTPGMNTNDSATSEQRSNSQTAQPEPATRNETSQSSSNNRSTQSAPSKTSQSNAGESQPTTHSATSAGAGTTSSAATRPSDSTASQLPSSQQATTEQQGADQSKANPAFNRDADHAYSTDSNQAKPDKENEHLKDYIIFGILLAVSIIGLIATYFINRKRGESK